MCIQRVTLAIAAVLASQSAFAAWDKDVEKALARIAQGANVQAAAEVMEAILDPNTAEEEWKALLNRYSQSNPYTTTLGQFWETAIAQGYLVQDRVARIAAFGAAAAVVHGFRGLGASGAQAESVRNGLIMLQMLGPNFDRSSADAVLAAFRDAASARAPDLRTPLTNGTPEQTVLAIQTCLTLAEYTTREPARRGRLLDIVSLPDRAASSWRVHGWFLFDRDALTPDQIQSLDSIASAIPPSLHRIAAVIVPDALGITPQQAGFASTGQVVSIQATPMTVRSDPAEFVPRVGQPTAPVFTLDAATEFFRAVEAVQFAQRPGLAARRDETVRRAGNRKERYLRRTILPEVYTANPAELLPLSSYLYFLDSERTFQTVLDLFNISQKPPMDAVLLIADVLSAGGRQTLIFRTTEAGIVQSVTTPVGRTAFAEPVPGEYLSAIRVKGSWWSFQFDLQGAVARWFRDQ